MRSKPVLSTLSAPPVCTVPEFRTRKGKVEALIVASEVSPWLLESRAPPYPNLAAPGMVSKAWALVKVGASVWKNKSYLLLTLFSLILYVYVPRCRILSKTWQKSKPKWNESILAFSG